MASALFALLVFGALVVLVDWMKMLAQRRKMPPGPFPLPILGNVFMYPKEKPWIWVEELSRRYQSPLITLWVGRTPTLWINDCWTAFELLERRAGNYCSRPRSVVLGDLALGQTNIVPMYYGERWRLHRRLTHQAVGMQHARRHRILQDDESKVTALKLLDTPDQYSAHFERYAASVVSIIGSTKRIQRVDDPLLTDVLASATQAGALFVPGKHFPMILEAFPIFASFPPLKRAFRTAMAKGRDFYFDMATKASEQPHNSYFKSVCQVAAKHDLSKEEIASLTGNLFSAGTDTTSCTLLTFTLACCAFPSTLPLAWEELDKVTGEDRSPSEKDLEQLPYVRAFVKEVFRWRPAAVLAAQPHAPLEDDYIHGYLIPRGTSCTGNLWAIHRHERDFPEPDRFCPERFLPGHPLHRTWPTERGYMTFGWGRRVCAAQNLAEQGVYLSVARLLWAFRIQAAEDSSKLDIFDYCNRTNIRPQPFRCDFIPRSAAIRATIEREGTQALQNLAQYE